jgi:hypothetical protein
MGMVGDYSDSRVLSAGADHSIFARDCIADAGMMADDKTVLRSMIEFARVHDTGSVLRMFGIEDSVAAHCCFDHVAALVFPSSIAALRGYLAAEGVVADELAPPKVRLPPHMWPGHCHSKMLPAL